MRLTAYKKCIDQAVSKEHPEHIELIRYFKDTETDYRDPFAIMTKARLDVEGLYLSEFVELYQYYLEQKSTGWTEITCFLFKKYVYYRLVAHQHYNPRN